jgi:Flp pilus assembly pilin Flp
MNPSTSDHQARRLLAGGEHGQTLVEYALILVLISMGTVAAMTFLKDAIAGVFSQVGNTL